MNSKAVLLTFCMLLFRGCNCDESRVSPCHGMMKKAKQQKEQLRDKQLLEVSHVFFSFLAQVFVRILAFCFFRSFLIFQKPPTSTFLVSSSQGQNCKSGEISMHKYHFLQKNTNLVFALFLLQPFLTHNYFTAKGQLILKCPLGVFKSHKKQRNFCKDFCPSL